MPIYEYACVGCGTTFSELAKIEDAGKPSVCPKCGAEAEFKPSVPVPFQRGPGWEARMRADGVKKPGRG